MEQRERARVLIHQPVDEGEDGSHAVGVVGAALHDLQLAADSEADVGMGVPWRAEGERVRAMRLPVPVNRCGETSLSP